MTDPQQPPDPKSSTVPAQLSSNATAAARALADKIASALDANDLTEHHVALINKVTGEMDLVCTPQPDGSIRCV